MLTTAPGVGVGDGALLARLRGVAGAACTPLWFVVYRLRPAARCVIHTHSLWAQPDGSLEPQQYFE